MGPDRHKANWLPGKGYSFFRFGKSIRPHVEAGLVLPEEPSPHPGARALSDRYVCPELECYVFTVSGLVHRILCGAVCGIAGYNLIGMNRRRLTELLAPARTTILDVDDSVALPGVSAERLIMARELGFAGDIPRATDMLRFALISGVGAGHERRDVMLDQQSGNVVAFRRRGAC